MGGEYRYIFAYKCIKKISLGKKYISWIYKKLAKLIAFREKIWKTGELSLYMHVYFMNHENVLFTRSTDRRRKGWRERKKINTTLGSLKSQASRDLRDLQT